MMADMDLRITRPCPIDLDARGVDRSGLGFRCDHCERDVHVLSNMTREAAERFVADHRGQRVCISYRRDESGRVRFADDAVDVDDEPGEVEPPLAGSTPLVPVARLRRAGALPRAASFALLAACAPHGETPPPAADDPIVVLERDPAPGHAIHQAVAREQDVEGVEEGEVAIADEPCVKEPTPSTTAPTSTSTRSPKKRQPPREKPPKMDIIDGGIDF